MTQIKLWQIVSQNANGIIFSDDDGNLKTLQAGGPQKVLVSGPDGAPMWADNSALVSALQAQTDAANALATAKAYTEAQIAALVDNAPIALNTLNELAQKLNGEDSAINALLLQVDGKADKTEVDTLLSLARREAKTYTDDTAANILSTASQDAFLQASNAKTFAVIEANAHTNYAVDNAIATATSYAQQKADEAQNNALAAANDIANTKVDELRDAIPGTFWVEGTSTACFLASSRNLDKSKAITDGLMVTESFTEVTGAKVQPNDPFLNAKLLFVNGVAMSDEWAAKKIGNGQLVITMSDRIAGYIFDGTENAVMLLAEYKSYNPITRIS